MKDKTFLTLAGLFFIVFIVGIAVMTFDKPAGNILRAKQENPSPLKSFVVIFPQIGVAGDEASGKKPTKLKVTVTIRDVNGAVLSNRQIQITTSLDTVSVTPSDTQTTNDNGQAEFFLTSSSTGTVKLTITDKASNQAIANVPTVEFTE